MYYKVIILSNGTPNKKNKTKQISPTPGKRKTRPKMMSPGNSSVISLSLTGVKERLRKNNWKKKLPPHIHTSRPS